MPGPFREEQGAGMALGHEQRGEVRQVKDPVWVQTEQGTLLSSKAS